jgi:4-oxalomesaconate tautomerase
LWWRRRRRRRSRRRRRRRRGLGIWGAMVQRMIPCFFMRGGTSRGTFFLKEHLPSDRATANKVLLEVMGSPDPRQIDGLGGGTSTTSKVAIISVSEEPGVDIDYQFAQVMVRWNF